MLALSEKNQLKLSDASNYRNELFGIAIISIIIFHYFEGVSHATAAIGFLKSLAKIFNSLIGSVGVDIFVFLSGYGIYCSLRKDNQFFSFLKKRVTRVIVPYAILGGAFWILKDLLIKHESMARFFYDYSLLSFWGDGVRTFWYISFIFLLYLLSPLVYKLGPKGMVSCCIVWFLLCVSVCFWAPIVFKKVELAILRGPTYFAGMYFGYYIATKGDLFLRKKELYMLCLAIPVKGVTAMSGFAFRRMFNGFYAIFLIAIAIIVLKIIIEKMPGIPKFLTLAGKYSLELYIVHVAIRNLMGTFGLHLYNLVIYILCILISIPISVVLSHLQKPKLT